MNGGNATVLVVDDDVVDRMAIHRAFKKMKIGNPIIEANDGIEALEQLRGQKGNALAAPFVVLLDLNMPRMGGIEFLQELRADPALQATVVFVLTTSNAPADRMNAYASHAAGYILKQPVGQSFPDAIGTLARYWTTIELPDGGQP